MTIEHVNLLKETVLLLFLCIFVGVVTYAIRMPASEADALRHLPLAGDEHPLETRGARHG